MVFFIFFQIIFVLCMAIFIVTKSDLMKHPELEKEAILFCESIKENDLSMLFEPKPGYLATFGLMLTEKFISYQLDFGPRP